MWGWTEPDLGEESISTVLSFCFPISILISEWWEIVRELQEMLFRQAFLQISHLQRDEYLCS